VQGELRPCFNNLTINIELSLLSSAVAYANGPRTKISAELFKVFLARGNFSEKIVEDAKCGLRQPGCIQQPGEKARCFLYVAKTQHGTHGQ